MRACFLGFFVHRRDTSKPRCHIVQIFAIHRLNVELIAGSYIFGCFFALIGGPSVLGHRRVDCLKELKPKQPTVDVALKVGADLGDFVEILG